MRKEFISFDTVRNNAIKLASQIYKKKFIPDVIYVSLRGGANIGNVISEYFKFVRKGKRPVYYAAVVARSYSDIKQQNTIRVDGWTYNPEYLRQGDKVLLVDDIFDTGRTINHLVDLIMEKGIPREDLKVAVHDYKIFEYKREQPPIRPDFYCRSHLIQAPEDDFWIHYISHELVGLNPAELEKYYLSKDTKLYNALKVINPEL